MLASIRRSARSWAAAAILFIALVAIVITGFGTGGIGGLGGLNPGTTGDTLASVDGQALTEAEASDIINRQYSQARQQDPQLEMRAFLASAFNPIIDQLILALAVQAFGNEQGLTVSPTMVDREIVNIPAFRNFAGQFDDTTFRQVLARERLTEAQLREDISRSLMQRQLLGPIARGVSVPEAIAREYANLLLERRRGLVAVVPTERLRAGIEPSDAELAAFYARNSARFTIPERRIVRYALIGPEQVAGAARATDAEIAEFYRQNSAAFGPRETRTLQSIVLPDQASAQAFAQRIRGGTSFAEAAGEAGFSAADVTFENQNQAQFAQATAAPVAAAAFRGGQGTVVGPIQSELGFHVVRVDRINATPARPLNAVRDEIARTLEQRKMAAALDELVSRIDERLAEGASVEEAARSERLTLQSTPPVTEQGQVPGQAVTVGPELQPILRAAFEVDADDPEPVVEQLEANRRFALIGVERVIPAAPPPLAQIRDEVREAAIQAQALERARLLATGVAGRINRGTPAAQAFAQAQPRLPTPEQVNLQRLEISRAGQQVPPPLLTLFSLPQGRAHVLPAPNGAGWFVVYHAERTPGDASGQPQLVASTRAEFSSSAAEETAQQFARSIERASGVERNPAAIRTTRQRLMGNVAE